MWLATMQYVFALVFGLLWVRDLFRSAASGLSDQERRYRYLKSWVFLALSVLYVILGNGLEISGMLSTLVE